MRFLTNGMLGKLTRWLRLAGHDVIYVGELKVPAKEQDECLVRKARDEGRILLTKDMGLYRRASKGGVRALLIRGTTVVSQIREISSEFGVRIKINQEKSRCPMCNGELEKRGMREVKNFLPEKITKSKRTFWICSRCGKIYWRGKHWKNILKTVRELGEVRA